MFFAAFSRSTRSAHLSTAIVWIKIFAQRKCWHHAVKRCHNSFEFYEIDIVGQVLAKIWPICFQNLPQFFIFFMLCTLTYTCTHTSVDVYYVLRVLNRVSCAFIAMFRQKQIPALASRWTLDEADLRKLDALSLAISPQRDRGHRSGGKKGGKKGAAARTDGQKGKGKQ